MNNSYLKLLIILSFAIVFPFVQRQWSNLYLFETNNYSFYTILYYISGIICPLLVSLNSIKSFTYYQFNTTRINPNLIKGKKLFIIILFTLLPLSLLISSYFTVNIQLFYYLFLDKSVISEINITQKFFIIIALSIFLISKKTRIIFKKLTLLNFILFAFFIWHANINNIIIYDNFIFNKYFAFENFNFINIIYLFLAELLYFIWSFISFKNNLSNWLVPITLKNNLVVYKIIAFYLLLVFYYSILK